MRVSNRTRRYYLACLAARAAAFGFLVVYALGFPARFDADLAAGPLQLTPLTVVWLALMLSMLFRLFPSRVESLGCQKEFAGRFRPTGREPSPEEVRQADRGALWVLLSWVGLNALFFLAYGWGGSTSGSWCAWQGSTACATSSASSSSALSSPG